MKKVIISVILAMVSLSLKAPPMRDGASETAYGMDMISEYVQRKERERQFELFLERLAHSESSLDPTAHNRLGYIGMWQFGNAALQATGYGHVSAKTFIQDPSIWTYEMQREAMENLIAINTITLKDFIAEYDGKTYRGVLVTKSGIIAAAHLAGAGGVKKYLTVGFNPRDKFGTSLTDYMIKFGGYEF